MSEVANLADMPELLTPGQLAERWGCSTGWLANMRCAGTGPAYLKLGSNVRYRVPDILTFEESCSVAA